MQQCRHATATPRARPNWRFPVEHSRCPTRGVNEEQPSRSGPAATREILTGMTELSSQRYGGRGGSLSALRVFPPRLRGKKMKREPCQWCGFSPCKPVSANCLLARLRNPEGAVILWQCWRSEALPGASMTQSGRSGGSLSCMLPQQAGVRTGRGLPDIVDERWRSDGHSPDPRWADSGTEAAIGTYESIFVLPLRRARPVLPTTQTLRLV